MSIRTHFLPVLAAACVAAVAAHAQTAAPASPTSITRDQLRACMNSADELKAKAAQFEQRNAESKAEQSAIRAESEQLGVEMKNAEGNQMRMDRVNRKVTAHNARLERANASLQALQKDMAAQNAAIQAYNTDCVNKSVNVEDRDAVMKERAEKK